MSIEIKGNGSSNFANVRTNGGLQVAFSDTSTGNGIVAITGRSDNGVFTGTPLDIDPEVDADYRLRVALDRADFQETWAGAALNSAQWSSTVTTMTTTVSGGYVRLNASAITTLNTVSRVTSYRTFAMVPGCTLVLDMPFQISAASIGILNTTVEFGFFIASGLTAPTDGIFVRLNSAGELRIVANYGGVETQSSSIDYSTLLAPNTDYEAVLVVSASTVYLWIDDVLVGTLEQPTNTPTFTQSQSLPVSYRVVNSASAPTTATTLLVGPMAVSTTGVSNVLTLTETAALMGGGGYQGQSGGTMGSTANWVNSTVPATATLSNTAAGYTTLGGAFLFAAPAGAETDFALFGYLVPATAAGASNKNLLIYGVTIDVVNLGAAVATTATVMTWAVGVGSTAVSLATAEAATTKARRVVGLGVQSLIVGDPIGGRVDGIRFVFTTPLLAEPGTYVHIILRIPVGTATASQVLRGVVGFNAAFV